MIADYNGDGKSDLAFFRASELLWYTKSLGAPSGIATIWGTNADLIVPNPRLDALFESQTVPTTMTRGQSYTVTVKMRNNGTTSWTPARAIKLGPQNPQDNLTWLASKRVTLTTGESINPGQSKTFTFTIKAPSTAGTYNFQWKMLQEGIRWFGAPSTNVSVTVN
jgi:hypothetical protein